MTSRTVKNESDFADVSCNSYEVNGQDAFARPLSTSKFGKPVSGDDFPQPLQTFCGCRLAPARRTDVYLRAGTARVLVVDPARRTTSTHDLDGTVVFAVADAHARGSIFASTREFLSTFGPTTD